MSPSKRPRRDAAHGPVLPLRARDEARLVRVNSERIIFLYHSPNCRSGKRCKYGEGCSLGRHLWAHILYCADAGCTVRNCLKARRLLWHFWHCEDQRCRVCAPVRAQLEVEGRAGGAGCVNGEDIGCNAHR
eukprot:evm.model.scf_1107EXC.3 EVM.evm.TU.scf_1107EXC.3   scf_1107EXC:37141-37533(-)